jgi:hypothetical protein
VLQILRFNTKVLICKIGMLAPFFNYKMGRLGKLHVFGQGILTEREGSVQFTSMY